MSTLKIDIPRWAQDFLAPSRYKAAYGGRGSGKSHFFAEHAILKHIQDPNRSTVCVRQIQKSLDQSVKRLLESKIEKFNAGYYFRVLDAKIESSQGKGLIIFQGMQNHTADSIKSLEGYKCAWVEEAQTLSAYSLQLLRPTIRVPNSELWFSWNPRYRSDAVDKFFRGKNPPQNAIIKRVNWQDNPWFPEVLRQEMQDDYERDEDVAAHIWDGDYGITQGAILAKWMLKAEKSGRVNDDVVFDRQGHGIVVSADLGFRDTAAFWFWQPCLGGVRVLAYDSDTGLDADDWIPRLNDKITELAGPGNKLSKIWLPHDARAKTFQSKETTAEKFIKAFGVDKIGIVPVARKSDQISASRSMIPKCEFNKTLCDDGIAGLNAYEYEYNEETGILSKEPRHDWASHPSDAFHYGAQVLAELQPKPQDTKPVYPMQANGRGGIVSAKLEDLWQLHNTKKRESRL